MASSRQPIEIDLPVGKKIYFASDQHLGSPNYQQSLIREKVFIKWLDSIKPDCEVLFLLGDLFDFWFEYKQVVPKGFVRTLGKLAELADNGIKIYFFTGNHDLWMRDYLTQELNATIFFDKQEFIINQKKFFIAHGDGLGPEDKGYKLMKRLFTNKVAQFLFYLLHPDFAVWLGKTMSLKNKIISGDEDVNFLGEDKEWLVQYARKKQQQNAKDFYIFGHRHMPLEIPIEEATYINLGDWIAYNTYAVFNGNNLNLKTYITQ